MADSDQPKRRRIMVAWITSLPGDLIWKIAKHILADDVVDYVCLRATCSALRSSLPDPYELAFCFLPRNWIRVYIGSGFNTRIAQGNKRRFSYKHESLRLLHIINCKDMISETRIPFMHLPTGRHAKLVLPELETHSILSVTDGLLILVHKQTSTMHLFNPLTRSMSADLPPTLEITKMPFNAITAVAPSRSTVEQPTLMVALGRNNIAYFAKPGDQAWVQIQLHFCTTSSLFFKGGFYCTDRQGSIWEIKPDQKLVNCVFYQDIGTRCWNLVESRTGMLLIDLYPGLAGVSNNASRKLNVFKVDLSANTIAPTNDVGNCTIFVGEKQQALLVIPTKISIKRNSIYICCPPQFIYHLKDRSTESTELIDKVYCFNILLNLSYEQNIMQTMRRSVYQNVM